MDNRYARYQEPVASATLEITQLFKVQKYVRVQMKTNGKVRDIKKMQKISEAISKEDFFEQLRHGLFKLSMHA